VRDKLLRFALQRGYHSHLMKGKFPIALLYVTVDPALVDVNVHPAKAELRFQYAQEVQNALVHAIREALRDGTWASANPPIKTVDSAPDDFDLFLPQRPEDDEVKTTVMRFDAQTPAKPAAAPAKPASQRPLDLKTETRSGTTTRPASTREPPASTAAPAFSSSGVTSYHAESKSTAREPSAAPAFSSPDVTNDRREPERPLVKQVMAAALPNADESPSAPVASASQSASGKDLQNRPLTDREGAAPSGGGRPRESEIPRSGRPADLRAVEGGNQPKLAPRAAAVTAAFKASTSRATVPSPDGQTVIPWADLQFIGPFARCFLLFEYQQQMLAIDQHAFHERVLYERLVENPDILRRTQPLLMPEVLVFSPTECERLVHMKDALDALGIQIQGVSDTEIEVTSVPSLLVNKDLNSLIAAILGGRDQASEIAHDVLATMACHAAVRAGEELPEPELKALLREAESVDFYHNCPHGRRVFRWWKLAQVASWFDR
jgi:DNA mismatch repair protein MutL